MFNEIQNEFSRLKIRRVHVELDAPTDSPARDRVKLIWGNRSCSVFSAGLLTMLQRLPDSAGDFVMRDALEKSARQGDAWAVN